MTDKPILLLNEKLELSKEGEDYIPMDFSSTSVDIDKLMKENYQKKKEEEKIKKRKEEVFKKLNLLVKYEPFKKFNMTCKETLNNFWKYRFKENEIGSYNFQQALESYFSYGLAFKDLINYSQVFVKKRFTLSSV